MFSAIPVVCTLDRGYMLPFAVLVSSLLTSQTSTPIRLYVIHNDLPADFRAAISQRLEVIWLQVDERSIRNLPLRPGIERPAYYRLLIPELLPQDLDRVLFLDCDMLVLGNLAELWNTDLEGSLLGAVQDMAIPLVSAPRGLAYHAELGIPAEARYFNAGVMLIDLAGWRQHRVAERCLEWLMRMGRRCDFLDQEALNAVLFDRWKCLEGRWNLIAGLCGRSFHPFQPDLRNPGLVHFAGAFKPWRTHIGGCFAKTYRQHLVAALDCFPTAGRPQANLRQKLLGWYDRTCRPCLYWLEQILWRRRWI